MNLPWDDNANVRMHQNTIAFNKTMAMLDDKNFKTNMSRLQQLAREGNKEAKAIDNEIQVAIAGLGRYLTLMVGDAQGFNTSQDLDVHNSITSAMTTGFTSSFEKFKIFVAQRPRQFLMTKSDSKSRTKLLSPTEYIHSLYTKNAEVRAVYFGPETRAHLVIVENAADNGNIIAQKLLKETQDVCVAALARNLNFRRKHQLERRMLDRTLCFEKDLRMWLECVDGTKGMTDCSEMCIREWKRFAESQK